MNKETMKINMERNNEMNKIKKNVDAYTNHPVITAPQIDKLSGVVDLKDAAYCGLVFSNIIDCLNDHEPGIVKTPVAGKYALSVKIMFPSAEGFYPSNSSFLLLQISSPKMSKPQVRFEYNPSHLTEKVEERLEDVYIMLFGMGFYQFLHHARFTKVDVCQNIHGTDIEDYLFRAKWSKVAQCFFGVDGKLETVTFSKSGNNQMLVYDKARQMHGPNVQHSTTRVEARCRINLTIGGLAVLKNPLSRLEIYSVECKNPPYGKAHWQGFQDSCRMRGITNALKKQPPTERKVLKKILKDQPVPWWGISDDDWEWLWTDALDSAGLLQIPDTAPPLTIAFHVGMAA
jgi:hypothetical protein